MHQLKKGGFEVVRGYVKVWPVEDCDVYATWGFYPADFIIKETAP